MVIQLIYSLQDSHSMCCVGNFSKQVSSTWWKQKRVFSFVKWKHVTNRVSHWNFTFTWVLINTVMSCTKHGWDGGTFKCAKINIKEQRNRKAITRKIQMEYTNLLAVQAKACFPWKQSRPIPGLKGGYFDKKWEIYCLSMNDSLPPLKCIVVLHSTCDCWMKNFNTFERFVKYVWICDGVHFHVCDSCFLLFLLLTALFLFQLIVLDSK